MTQRITQQQLESYLWGAATLLRGTIDAGDYKQFIFPLLFFKRLCDVFDEETAVALAESGGDQQFAAYPENHRFQIPAESHWRQVRKTAKNVGQAIQAAMRAIETANPDKLFGIFGDAQWSKKNRLSDAMLRDLIEHFSTLQLTVANLPEDELGNGYEYLIKKFADDSGHTAAEFYTNRTVVHLMTEMLQPQPGESIYDPTCGSGGMLLSSIAHLRQHGQEWRNVRLYGQERNLMTSSIARMNCFLHGIEDFQIVRGDTLAEPKFVQGDRLMQFDMVLANPPYSIKQWDRAAFASDPWGRNLFGTPPQGRADYAFWQHILGSLAPKTGRCAILFPHGVLFRQEEAEMRQKLIEADQIECVLGLGPNLFYNSPMEACVVVCRAAKPRGRKGKVLFINAVSEVTRERTQSFLTDDHIDCIVASYRKFKDEPGFARVATLEKIRCKDANLSIPLYVAPSAANGTAMFEDVAPLAKATDVWVKSRIKVSEAIVRMLPDVKLPAVENRLRASNVWRLLDDRAKWCRVRFGDVVQNLSETERDPSSAGIERFIGLEHLEPGSLHVRNWGNVADGTTFTRRCRPGEVLFGKRRAYQRKVAITEFDAVVSGDIYVLASKDDRLLRELLPFLCLSERFFQHAVGTSAGSLSPRTNWNSLASFEFGLPPLDQQRRIAELFCSVDAIVQAHEATVLTVAQGLRDIATRLFTTDLGGDGGGSWQSVTIEDIAADEPHAIVDGPFGSSLKTLHYRPSGIPVIQGGFVTSGSFGPYEDFYIDPEHFERVRRSAVAPGDIVMTRVGENAGACAIVPANYPIAVIAGNCIKIRTDPKRCLARYLRIFLAHEYRRNGLVKVRTTTAQPAVSLRMLKKMHMPLPQIKRQLEIVEFVEQLEGFMEIEMQSITSAKSLGTELRSAILS